MSAESPTNSPPYDLTAEKLVLAAMMCNPDAPRGVRELVDSDDFYDSIHAGIFQAALACWEAGENIDGESVALRHSKPSAARRCLNELSTLCPDLLEAESNARLVAEDARSRRELRSLSTASTKSYPTDADRIQEIVSELSPDAQNSGPSKLWETQQAAWAKAAQDREAKRRDAERSQTTRQSQTTPHDESPDDTKHKWTAAFWISCAMFIGGCLMARPTEEVWQDEEYLTLYDKQGREQVLESPARKIKRPRPQSTRTIGIVICVGSGVVAGIAFLRYNADSD